MMARPLAALFLAAAYFPGHVPDAAAQSATATLTSTVLDEMNAVLLADDGVGIDRALGQRRRFRVVMMRERATQLNGRFDFDSTPGDGRTIRVNIPFR